MKLATRNTLVLVALLATGFCGTQVLAADQGISLQASFNGEPVGGMPAGFNSAQTGNGVPPAWIVQHHELAGSNTPYLVQVSADRERNRFPLLVATDFTATDVELAVDFLPVSGTIDQAAGLVWRYQDPDNYYVVRANALEDNVVLYKVVNGRRSDIRPEGAGLFAYGKSATVGTQQWQRIRLVARGNRHSVYLNGEHLFDVVDDSFTESGGVGLWTKADSVTAFDNFSANRLNP